MLTKALEWLKNTDFWKELTCPHAEWIDIDNGYTLECEKCGAIVSAIK